MSDIFERILMLKKSPMFSEVHTEDLRAVAQELEEDAYFAGDRVFEINDYGDHMYLIQSGRIGISLNADKTSKDFIAELGPGECFGEMGLLDDQPRSATAHVLEESHILTLEKGRLRGLIVSYPELALGMLRGISQRLRATNLRTL